LTGTSPRPSKSSPSRRIQRPTSRKRPLSVAITGAIGAGKSEALVAFARHGAATISSDEIVHELIAQNPEVRAALLERFGTTERSEIGAVVFGDREQLEWLERLLHPRVAQHYLSWRERQTAGLTVTEIPLLYETGGEARFDKVVLVTAPKSIRDGRRRPLAGERESRFIDDEEKAKHADYVYVNTGSLEALDEFVSSVVQDLTS
jgi:dephospho-CoA kinase